MIKFSLPTTSLAFNFEPVMNQSSSHVCHGLQKEADIALVSEWEAVLLNEGQTTILLIGFESLGFVLVVFLFCFVS